MRKMNMFYYNNWRIAPPLVSIFGFPKEVYEDELAHATRVIAFGLFMLVFLSILQRGVQQTKY
jgi:hypothetical protein